MQQETATIEKQGVSAAEAVKRQRQFFATGQTLDVKFRVAQLKKLRTVIEQHEQEIMDALMVDLGKSQFESFATEIGMALNPISHAIKNTASWAKPKRVPTPLFHFIGSSHISLRRYFNHRSLELSVPVGRFAIGRSHCGGKYLYLKTIGNCAGHLKNIGKNHQQQF
jgi:acyl-CoA reductase-like NAD-dependent aldehyde dehydrogenase